MADVTDNGLRAAVKALTDVVAPSIDRGDPLAQEQLRLVVDYLEFVRCRLDFLYDRDRFELGHELALANALQRLHPPCSASTAQLLNVAIEAGTQADAAVGTSTVALKAASAALAAAARELIREAAAFAAEARSAIERQVIKASGERILFERAWYLPLGFDPAPGDVPPLAAVLAKTASSGTRRAP